MIENPGSRKTDRVVATNWMNRAQVREAIRDLKFSYACLSPLVTSPGSNERRAFELSLKGFRHDVDYILDSLDRLLEAPPQSDVKTLDAVLRAHDAMETIADWKLGNHSPLTTDRQFSVRERFGTWDWEDLIRDLKEQAGRGK